MMDRTISKLVLVIAGTVAVASCSAAEITAPARSIEQQQGESSQTTAPDSTAGRDENGGLAGSGGRSENGGLAGSGG